MMGTPGKGWQKVTAEREVEIQVIRRHLGVQCPSGVDHVQMSGPPIIRPRDLGIKLF